jgi:hypothetical protein
MDEWEGKQILEQLPVVMSKGHEFNTPPENFTLITEIEFSHSSFWIYFPVAVEHRQFEHKGSPINLLMYWGDKYSGYAMSRDYYAGKVLYYHFGCEHDYRVETIGRCRHKWTCKKCGHERVVDSSD